MKNRMVNKNMKLKGLLAAFMLFLLICTSSFAYLEWSKIKEEQNVQYALVKGNVEKPGYYKVDEITTNFELLQKAGLNDSSKINHIKLIQNVQPEKALEVEISDEKVKKKILIDFSEPRFEYFIGNITLKRQLKIIKTKIDQPLQERDKISTQSEGKARIAFQNKAIVDVNVNTDLKIMEINRKVSPTFSTLKLESGQIWVSIPKGNPGAKLYILTPNSKIDLGEQDVEVIISVKNDETSVHVSKGEVKVLDIQKSTEITLKQDQIFVVNSDLEESQALQQKFAKKDVIDAFSDLQTAYISYTKSQTEVSLLLTSGGFNMVVSFIPKKDKIIFMDLPKETYVGDYVDGVFRLDQALALAGSEITREIVERIIARPVPFVFQLDYSDIFRFAYTLNGITVEVDPSAAVVMGVTPGIRRLEQKEIIQFLNPDLPGGQQAAIRRQKKIFHAFLRKLKEGGLGFYASLLSDLISKSNTNLPVKDAMKIFQVYNEKDNWRVMNIRMPSTTITKGQLVMAKPDYNLIRVLYTN